MKDENLRRKKVQERGWLINIFCILTFYLSHSLPPFVAFVMYVGMKIVTRNSCESLLCVRTQFILYRILDSFKQIHFDIFTFRSCDFVPRCKTSGMKKGWLEGADLCLKNHCFNPEIWFFYFLALQPILFLHSSISTQYISLSFHPPFTPWIANSSG